MKKLRAFMALTLLLIFGLTVGAAEPRVLTMATTTSTENSGLLAYVLPDFEQTYNLKVHVVAVGTGQALKLGENGDADVLMVHAPDAEMKFMDAGFGVNRRPFMKNDFVLVGPNEDPAYVKGSETLEDALSRIVKANGAVFISRGDNSGTHMKEQLLWKDTGLAMPADRLLSIGQGMEAALRMADEKRAYTLADRGTYLALRDKLALTVIFDNDPRLDNPYAVIAVNPARYPDINYMDAMLLIAWLTSPAGQQKIASFQVHNQTLFFPTAIPQK